ncbi:MAG: hypothetical protein LQ343_001598, partial [Gyalolechia ehrenbergii]
HPPQGPQLLDAPPMSGPIAAAKTPGFMFGTPALSPGRPQLVWQMLFWPMGS